MKITVESVVRAPMDAVWSAYTTPDDIVVWNAASSDWHTVKATLDLRAGGKFSSRMEAKDGSAGFDFEGTYTHVVPHQRIEYVMADQRAVVVEFLPEGEAVRVRVTFDAETVHSEELQRGGWQAILDNFAKHVEAKRS